MMNIHRLILRNLAYFRGVNLAVIAGVAIATAALTGALMVGDSVRQSLIDLATQRLGRIDHALIGGPFFQQSLARRISEDSAISGKVDLASAIIMRGGATRDSTRAAGIEILAADRWISVSPGQTVLNPATAQTLDLPPPGSDVFLSVPAESDVPRDATLARRSREDTLSGLRANVARIESGGLWDFSIAAGQRATRNAWVNLADLQDAVGQREKINAIFVSDPSHVGVDALNDALKRNIMLTDYGLSLSSTNDGSQTAITSSSTYIPPAVEAAAQSIAQQRNVALQKINVNLINVVNRIAPDGTTAASIHYAVAAGMTQIDGQTLAVDEIALNQWAAERLGAKVGDRIRLSFYVRQSDGSLVETSSADRGFSGDFRIARTLPMAGIGTDPSLTPAYKGLTDSDSVANWDPPEGVEIDKSLVTPADEDYWKQHKAAPKLFVNYDTARRLWGAAHGNATSLRIPAGSADEFSIELLATLDPAQMGLNFRAIRQERVAAASGTTDFGQLFIAFSFFLIVAAALLTAMLMRLNVEQRARQLGAMSALGFTPAAIRRIILAEGMLLCIFGGVVGSIAGIAYTWLLVLGLRTWWVGAVGATALRLHVNPVTMLIGFLISQIVGFVAIRWAVGRISQSPPARLLAGGWATQSGVPQNTLGVAGMTGILGLPLGLLIIAGGLLGKIGQQGAFLGGGAILLISGLSLANSQLRLRRGSGAVQSMALLGIRNTRRHPARSVLCMGLIALAAFALVTVAAMRRGDPADTGDSHSGSGGYRLMIDSPIPLLGNPGTTEGRSLLGFRDAQDPLWDRAQFLPLRKRAADDVSCRNLMRSANPSILAVPDAMIEQAGFQFAYPRGNASHWTLLRGTLANGEIPIIADDNTARYVLHLSPGQTLVVDDAAGNPRTLRLVATLSGSIFQSELLMSEENFRDMFPGQAGFGLTLVKVDPRDMDAIRRGLSEELSEFAASVETTASVLAGFLEVQNTYLSTFELLGALGLMLGTIGLAVVLVRTIIERKAELAVLGAIGFGSGAQIRLVLAENAFLLVAGLGLGTTCALIGVAPALRESAGEINFRSLSLTLAAVLAIGLCASSLAAWLGGRKITAADLRRE